MTLIAGAIFGLLWGTVIVSFASSIGATLAFLASRFLLRDWVQAKFGDKLAAINRGVEKEGAFYLFALRLVPAFPFFVINLVMGLTPIKTLDVLLGQPGRDARRHDRLRVRRHPARQVSSLAGLASPALLGVVRAARHLPAHREEGRSTASRRARCMRTGSSPRDSTATWS